MVRPEFAVAVSAVVVPTATFDNAPNVIVWLALLIVPVSPVGWVRL